MVGAEHESDLDWAGEEGQDHDLEEVEVDRKTCGRQRMGEVL